MITSKFTSKTSKLLAITSNLHPNKGGGAMGPGLPGDDHCLAGQPREP